MNQRRNGRQRKRQRKLVAVPRDVAAAEIFQVVIQSGADDGGRVAAQNNLPATLSISNTSRPPSCGMNSTLKLFVWRGSSRWISPCAAAAVLVLTASTVMAAGALVTLP